MNTQIISNEIDGLTNIFKIEKEYNEESITVLKINPDKTIEKLSPELIGNLYIKTITPLATGTILVVFYLGKNLLEIDVSSLSKLKTVLSMLEGRITTLEKSVKNRVTHKELSRIPSEQFKIPFIG